MGKLEDLLANQEVIILDGALGTELEERGYDVSGKLWSAKYLLKNPRIIQYLHSIYLRSGADILTTSSYQATVQGLTDFGLSEKEALDIIALTVTLAQQARDEFWRTLSDEEKAKRSYPLIAGDVGPYAAYLADGSEYTGHYHLSKEAYQAFHHSRIQTLLAAGCDFLAIETIPNVHEAKALIDLLATDLCEQSPQVLAFGINCSSPTVISGLLKRIRTVS